MSQSRYCRPRRIPPQTLPPQSSSCHCGALAMNRRSLPLVGALLILNSVLALGAEVIVKTEQVNPANQAGQVKTIPGSSKSDLASSPEVTDVWVAFKTHFDIGYTDTIE